MSDAGMPIISDPGQNLVSYLRGNDYNVIIIPGVTALITAIVGSGFDSSKFTFEGFLSISKKQRKKHLEDIKNEKRTMIFYEAPHKILYTLKDLLEALGDRKICICRELTKIYEEYKITTIKQAIEYIDKNGIKGEIVLIVEGKNKETIEEDLQKKLLSIPNATLVKEYINSGMDKKDAIKAVAKEKGIPKNEVYKDCLDL